jgi:tRNA (cmo5U34)-methyltransferase
MSCEQSITTIGCGAGKTVSEACERKSAVNYIVGDFHRINGNYDVVLSSLALHHLPTDGDKQHLYRRIYDSLAPGGVFYTADVVLGS